MPEINDLFVVIMGISTVFVLSGEGTMKDVEESETKPEFIYENIRVITDELIKG